MTKPKNMTVNVTGIDQETHRKIKAEAVRRGVKVNDFYLKVIDVGAKVMRIITEAN